MTTFSRDSYAIIPHPENPCILLLQEGDNWTLPYHSEDGTTATNQAIKRLSGLEVTILYTAYEYDSEQEDNSTTQRIDVLEIHNKDWQLPATAHWVSFQEFQKMTLLKPEHAKVIRKWFQENVQSFSTIQRRPWVVRGQYTIILSWVGERLAEEGYHIKVVEQLAVSDWSYILRIQTQKGNVFLKCCDPAFSHEPALTQILSQLYPMSIPRVISIDRARHWMLMEDAGQVLDEQYPEKARELACWQQIIPAYVAIQIEAIQHCDQLLKQGCPDRRLHLLPELFETALADKEMWCVGQDGGLAHEEVTQLHRSIPGLKMRCKALESYEIPETLHHDDLHAGNIMIHDDHFIFFDWAESFIAHPFYSLAIIQRYLPFFTNEQLNTLSEVYLQPWTVYASMERLREAFELAQPLGLLCRGLTWYTYLKSLGPETRQKYVLNWPYWLQLFLEAMHSKS